MTFARPSPAAEQERNAARRAANLQALATATLRPVSAGSYSGTTAGPVPKRTYIRSKALLAAVRTLPCMRTGRVGETEPAHSNWPQHGKSGRVKADDNRVAALARDVHRELDQGKNWSAEERQRIWWDAHVRTVHELLARGLWPHGVPVPQLEDFWK